MANRDVQHGLKDCIYHTCTIDFIFTGTVLGVRDLWP